MIENVVVEPMMEDFILWRCLHESPLSRDTIDQFSPTEEWQWKRYRDRNIPFLVKLTRTYGSCAMLAIEGDFVVGHARFYPEVIFDLAGQKHICCQDPRFSVTKQMFEMDLPSIENPADRILRIHCWLIHKDYQGRGVSHVLLESILEWAKSHGWRVIKAYAGPDNYWLASHACSPMLRTFIKHGFLKIKTVPSSELKELLIQFQEGKFGIELKKEFNKFCAGEDLSEIAVYHEVECRL